MILLLYGHVNLTALHFFDKPVYEFVTSFSSLLNCLFAARPLILKLEKEDGEFSTVRMLYNIGIQVNILASKVSCVGCVLSLPLYFSFCLCTTAKTLFIYLLE